MQKAPVWTLITLHHHSVRRSDPPFGQPCVLSLGLIPGGVCVGIGVGVLRPEFGALGLARELEDRSRALSGCSQRLA